MTVALVDNRITDECERALLIRGYNVIRMPAARELSPPMASHPDMLLFYHKGQIISTADYGEVGEYVFTDLRCACDVKMKFTSSTHADRYPRDAILNALVIGDRLFCKRDTVDEAVLSYAKEAGLKIVPTRQGYPACTVLALDESHAITADRGMGEVMRNEGISVTLIEDGDISLPPYEYGFIGGASGVDGNCVYFLGDVTRHRSYDKIKCAIDEVGMSIVSLGKGPLEDLGRIIFIPEHTN
ncbi:MAG: hypothetical protein J6Q69_04925 [Clostridia bacterium]|nr:hypothetical protein [Clostridia bacterium]